MSMDDCQLKEILASGETLQVEFKSDLKCLSDRDLISAIVALANTEGGDLLLGVEDSGTITGLHSNHQDITGLAALVANRTSPPLSVRIELCPIGQQSIARIRVPKSRQLVATSEGLFQRRRLKADGKPEAVPFYPHEFTQRQSVLGLTDPSALPMFDLTSEDLNPLERQRIREAIRRYGGDTSLIPLADDELDGALGLATTIEGVRRPTLAGLLFLGREEQLRQYFPCRSCLSGVGRHRRTVQ